MNKTKVFLVLSLFSMGFLFFSAQPAYALNCSPIFKGITPDGCLIPKACTDSQAGKDVNDCGLTEALQTVINFSQLLLALTGSAALLVFIYGGLMWILAAGKAEMIDKGRQALVAAVVGMVIVLSSWLIVNSTINALSNGKVGTTPAKIFESIWSQEPTVESPGSGATDSTGGSATESNDEIDNEYTDPFGQDNVPDNYVELPAE